MTTIKNMTEEKGGKKLKRLIEFHIVPIISTSTTEWGEKGKKIKKKKIQKNLQNKSKYKNDEVFLESLLSESFPTLGIPVHLTSLGCPPTLY